MSTKTFLVNLQLDSCTVWNNNSCTFTIKVCIVAKPGPYHTIASKLCKLVQDLISDQTLSACVNE